MENSKRALVVALAIALGGCASINSRQLGNNDAEAHGLVYYLPTQDLVLTLVVAPEKDAEGNVRSAAERRTLTLAAGETRPDTSQALLLRYSRNQAGKSAASIGITRSGLLHGESKGESTGGLGEVLKALATTAGSVSRGDPGANLQDACSAAGTYSWILQYEVIHQDGKSPQDGRLNGFKVPKAPAGATSLESCGIAFWQSPSGAHAALTDKGVTPSDKALSGVYYRQALPLHINVVDQFAGTVRAYAPLLVTPASPTHFLPIPESLFAKVEWKLTFDHGTPTLYDITGESDLVGLVTLPADVLAAYSTGLTAGFTRSKSEAEAELAAYQALAKLAAQQAAYEACRKAAEGEDLDAIKAACQ